MNRTAYHNDNIDLTTAEQSDAAIQKRNFFLQNNSQNRGIKLI
jgi:hypothetical protein